MQRAKKQWDSGTVEAKEFIYNSLAVPTRFGTLWDRIEL